MLMLLFQLGNSRYAIPAAEVVEIAPHVNLETIAMAPDCVRGLFNYRGLHVPVIDLHRLINDSSCSDSFTSRIILVNYPLADGTRRILGLLAERVTETIDIDGDSFTSTGLNMEQAPFLGDAARCEAGLVQRISVTELLPESIQSQLFPAEAG
ncbi:MAG TPA: chemotaxis protein CheW [Gammaproteobacteria bacterium]|nr:chemotaxis protein CheW [Gammaproteobacteria bacterium]